MADGDVVGGYACYELKGHLRSLEHNAVELGPVQSAVNMDLEDTGVGRASHLRWVSPLNPRLAEIDLCKPVEISIRLPIDPAKTLKAKVAAQVEKLSPEYLFKLSEILDIL